MRPDSITDTPADAALRRAARPVICYPVETLPRPDLAAYRALRGDLELTDTTEALKPVPVLTLQPSLTLQVVVSAR